MRVASELRATSADEIEVDQKVGPRVVFAEHHTLFAQTITHMLEAHDFEVVSVAASAGEAIDKTRELDPDLVLVDVDLPGSNGSTSGHQVKDAHPTVTMIAIGSSDDEEKIDSAYRCGFEGFISKDAAGEDFITYIQNVVDGGSTGQSKMRPSRRQALDEVGEAQFRASYLTPREREVLTLLTEGTNSKDLASRLSLSPHTVRSHVQGILAKLQVHSRLEAAAFATRFGLVETNVEAIV
jgi:two-component system nitrate/nitrite response regulator NarL